MFRSLNAAVLLYLIGFFLVGFISFKNLEYKILSGFNFISLKLFVFIFFLMFWYIKIFFVNLSFLILFWVSVGDFIFYKWVVVDGIINFFVKVLFLV